MRRLNKEFPGVLAPQSRLAFAVVFSAAAHLVLIYGLALPPGSAAVSRSAPINARLMPSEPVPLQARREPVPAIRPATTPSVAFPAEAAPPAVSANPDRAAEPPILDPVPAAAGLPEPPDLVHYAAKDLDIYPLLQAALHPVYPETARAQKLAGAVTLLLLIDESGRVVSTTVVDAVPEGLFEDSARQAFSGAAFTPAQKDGRRVRSRILVSVNYDPNKP